MDNEMLTNIEYLREKANVSYEDAGRLLETYGGNVMRALVDLEQQGLVYGQQAESHAHTPGVYEIDGKKAVQKTSSFLQRALQTRLIVEKKQGGGDGTVLNLSVPVAALIAVCAPWVAVGSIALGICTGHTARVEREKAAQAA